MNHSQNFYRNFCSGSWHSHIGIFVSGECPAPEEPRRGDEWYRANARVHGAAMCNLHSQLVVGHALYPAPFLVSLVRCRAKPEAIV